MTVLDVFSWLPAKEISIEELEQIFIGHLNGTYKGNTRCQRRFKIVRKRQPNFGVFQRNQVTSSGVSLLKKRIYGLLLLAHKFLAFFQPV